MTERRDRKTVLYVGSPFTGENSSIIGMNVKYAVRCARAVALAGFVPWAPHLHDPQFLDDGDAAERSVGLENGLEMLSRCDGAMFFIDRGTSSGMRGEISFCQRFDIPMVVATLDDVSECVVAISELIMEKRHAGK